MTSYEIHPTHSTHAVIEPGYLPDIPPPPLEIDDYARIYGPPHIRELGYWGVGVSIVGALFMSAGLCLQKAVLRKIASNPNLGPPTRHTLYIAGVAYVGMGLLLKALIDILLPQSANAPLSAQTILYTSILEYLFLEGELKRAEIVALLTIAVGIVMATLGANTIDGEYGLADLFRLYERAISIIATAVLAALLLTVREIARTSSLSFSDTKGLIHLSLCAGMFAGWTGTITKSLAEVVKYAFLHGMRREDAAGTGLWMLILALPLFGIPKLRFVASALIEFHPTQFLPCYQAAAIAANALCGIIYFNDFGSDRIEGTNVSLPLYLCGTTITCLGTLLLVARYNPQKHLMAYDEEESRGLLIDDGKAGLREYSSRGGSSTYDDEFGTRDVRTPNGKHYAPSIVVKSGAPSGYWGGEGGSSSPSPTTPGKFIGRQGASSGSTPTTPSHGRPNGARTPTGTPGRTFIPRAGSGVKLAPNTPGKPDTPGRPKTPSTPLSPFSAVARRGNGIDEAMALAQMQGSYRAHRRNHSGQLSNYADLRDALSPFEGESQSGMQMYSPAKPKGAIQARYVGSMEGLDVDSREMKWVGGGSAGQGDDERKDGDVC